jgi:hypothetical protein
MQKYMGRRAELMGGGGGGAAMKGGSNNYVDVHDHQ